MSDLKKSNRNPIYHQYITLTEEVIYIYIYIECRTKQTIKYIKISIIRL